jgi:hypothetical protein
MEGLEARINNPSMQACTPPITTQARSSGDHAQSYQTSVIKPRFTLFVEAENGFCGFACRNRTWL